MKNVLYICGSINLNFMTMPIQEAIDQELNYVIEYAKARTNLICVNITARTTLDMLDSFSDMDNLKDVIREQLKHIKKISE